MTVEQLKKFLDKLPDASEVVVHADSTNRDYEVIGGRVKPFGSRYFSGHEPKSEEPDCLVLDIY